MFIFVLYGFVCSDTLVLVTIQVSLTSYEQNLKHIFQYILSEHPANIICSDGVGRTGVFIAVDRLIQHVRDHDEIDIYSVILDMRKYRQWMVKSEVSHKSTSQTRFFSQNPSATLNIVKRRFLLVNMCLED